MASGLLLLASQNVNGSFETGLRLSLGKSSRQHIYWSWYFCGGRLGGLDCMAKWAAIAGKPKYKNEGMIYVWLGAFIPCIVFPFIREPASLLSLHSPDVSIRPSIPKQ